MSLFELIWCFNCTLLNELQCTINGYITKYVPVFNPGETLRADFLIDLKYVLIDSVLLL